MSVDQPFNIYREQLSSQYHGLALWDPKPVENLHKHPGHVSIGDVGYLDNGAFMRMFNVTLPWDDPSNKLLGKPEKYERIEPSYFSNVRDNEIREGEYPSPYVSKVDNVGANRHEDSIGQLYQCRARHRGALLSLPHKGHRKDVIPIKVFEDYIRDNVDKWFRWSKKMKLPVERMEDLILVTGCTLVASWAAAAFDGHISLDSNGTEISLEARKSDDGGTQYFWRNIRGNVEYHNSRLEPNIQGPLPQNQCVFVRGFRAKRRLFRTIRMRAAAEPLPDDPDNCWEDEIQVTRIPDSSNYRDPLVGILDYIIQKCNEDNSAAEDIVAIAHDDDLQLIEGVETLTADAIEVFLREKQIPLSVKNGSAILRDPAESEPPVSHEKKKGQPGQIHQRCKIYREQLSSKYQGIALWHPSPLEGLYHISIGDVGYLNDGAFIRIFNATLPFDDPSNSLFGKLEEYVPLDASCSDIARTAFGQETYHSVHVSEVDNRHANTPDEYVNQTYRCKAGKLGALLSLPRGGFRENVTRTRAFEDYIKDNVDNWFRWSKEMKLPVEHMQDLILVTGCTLAASWAAAAFDGRTSLGSDGTEISLEARKSDDGGAQYLWRNVRGNVEYHNSHFDPNAQEPLPQNQCVFIRGFRAKRRFFRTKVMRAAAEPLPDDPDNRREDEIQVTRISDSSNPHDPLVGVLDYIIQKCNEDNPAAEDIMAIAHDDDLQLIEDMDALTGNLIEECLRENQMPLVVENGVAILRHPAEYKPPVFEEKKVVSLAASELNGEPVPLVIHPGLTKFDLKLDASDRDYDLSKEINAPTAYPPMLSRLEDHKGYPQIITLEASVDSRGIGGTVRDVLRTIHEDMKMPFKFPGCELSELGVEERAGINATFGEILAGSLNESNVRSCELKGPAPYVVLH